MSIRYVALDSAVVCALRDGAADANGHPPERRIAAVGGYPCRHCMRPIDEGEAFLVLAHRPFPKPQPYAELGPIFLHAEPCERGGGDAMLPAFLGGSSYIVRGYGTDDRIIYGSGGVVEIGRISDRAAKLLGDPGVAYVHVRSASNNCYHCRIERA